MGEGRLPRSANCLDTGGPISSTQGTASGLSRMARQINSVGQPGKKHFSYPAEERELITLIVNGFTNKDMARYFCLSERTLYRRVVRVRNKLGAANRFDLVLAAIDGGF